MSFYGHFPDIDDSHPATVAVELEGVGRKEVTLKKYVGNQLSFVLPGEYVKEGRFVEMTITLPVLKYGVWHTTDETHARIYIEQRNAFQFDGTAYEENPDLWATVNPNVAHEEHADSSRTTNSQTLTAVALFSSLIEDNTKYDMSTATFIQMAHREDKSGAPCHCGCDPGASSFGGFDANTVTFALSAPTCGATGLYFANHWE